MPACVALLRGINIGPKKRIRMEVLRALIEDLGHTEVRTWVNSGNVVFATDRSAITEIALEIEAALQTEHGLDVPVVVRTGEDLARIVAGNPFPKVAATPKLLHVSFLGDVPEAALVEALAVIEQGDDKYRVVSKDVYLHYPHGISGATFMVNGFDKSLKVTSTSRNWSTVTRLAEMAQVGR